MLTIAETTRIISEESIFNKLAEEIKNAASRGYTMCTFYNIDEDMVTNIKNGLEPMGYKIKKDPISIGYRIIISW